MPRTNFTPIITIKLGSTSTIGSDTIDPFQPTIPRNFNPKLEERYISYVLEMKGDATSAEVDALKVSINKVLSTALSGYFPELLFAKKDVFKIYDNWIKKGKLETTPFVKLDTVVKFINDIKIKKQYQQLPFILDRLFPGSEGDYKNAKKFGLHRFLLLILPVFERQFKRKTTDLRFEAVMHEISYKLRDELNIISCNACVQFKGYRTLSSGAPEERENTLPRNWHITNTNSSSSQLPSGVNGQGVLIAHPDSGWTPHPELNFANNLTDPFSPNFDLTRDWNVFNDQNTAEESLASNAFTHFHGTATASLIISNIENTPGNNNLSGIAPRSTILPIRCIAESQLDTGVVLISDTDVARAIWYSTRNNVDIISLSLGGYPAPALESVIAHAVYNNIIVVAAAGNIWPFVVFPALYPECIAVGASNASNRPWINSARGSKVAFSAPGEDIYCADWDNSSPNRRAIINTSGPDGTSFSTAITAGAAALWLQRYSKQTLINGLNGRATLQELFLAHVRTTATLPSSWNTSINGAGILNVANLLNSSTLPNLSLFSGQNWNNWRRRTAMELLYILFENTDPAVVSERIEEFLNTTNPEAFMERFGQEILNSLVCVPDAVNRLHNSMGAATREAEEAIEGAVEQLKDVVSDAVGTVTGWFT